MLSKNHNSTFKVFFGMNWRGRVKEDIRNFETVDEAVSYFKKLHLKFIGLKSQRRRDIEDLLAAPLLVFGGIVLLFLLAWWFDWK
jgi:hypothetical protein